MMGVMSDLEFAEYLIVARGYVPGDRLVALAARVTAWLDALEAGDQGQLSASRDALDRELEDLGAGVRDPAMRQEGASPPETGAVQHDSPKPDPELIRRIRELYPLPGQR
jgi:hypothetical protein